VIERHGLSLEIVAIRMDEAQPHEKEIISVAAGKAKPFPGVSTFRSGKAIFLLTDLPDS
jgi:hypothetical protein